MQNFLIYDPKNREKLCAGNHYADYCTTCLGGYRGTLCSGEEWPWTTPSERERQYISGIGGDCYEAIK